MKFFLCLSLLLFFSQVEAENLKSNKPISDNNKFIIVPSGPLSEKPIISDATFAIIGKKNNLSEKDFTEEDIKKLDIKFNKVVATLRKEKVFEKVAIIAPKYGVTAESVAACIIGEHVFNVSIADKFQSYFIDIYSKWIDKHNAIRDVYLNFLNEPEVDVIIKSNNTTDYEKWDAIFDVYNKKYRGTKDYPNSNFIFSFFNPYGAGLTYGLGQLSPIRVLLTNDIAVKYGGLKKINATDTEALYFSTLDVDTNINYVAASVVASVVNYKKYANFDISNNMGVIATLYNLGNEKKRAKQLNKTNESLLKSNKQIELPVENFYGWYMNKKENEIKELVNAKNNI